MDSITQEPLHSGAPENAVVYARMSSELQQNSIEIQIRAAIEYAKKNNFIIIDNFIDEGISGLTFKRPALQKLINEVCSNARRFSSILVFDISRWSRAEDADESAYYEYICRSKGVKVLYICEQFINDGSAMATVMKAMKRAMAFEYSRELSHRVSLTKAKMLEKGYTGGGAPVYGFQRISSDPFGKQKRILKAYERKPRPTDRVMWIPGPESEAKIVRWIFQKYADNELGISSLVYALNKKKIKPPPYVTKWYRGRIRGMLQDERYIGTHICYKSKQKLGAISYADPDQWVRKEQFYTPIVDPIIFKKVQNNLAKNATQRRWTLKSSKQQLGEKLKECLVRHGRLTSRIIRNDPALPSTTVFIKTFGSVNAAYKFINYYSVDRPRYEMRVRHWPQSLNALRMNVIDKLSKNGIRLRHLPGKGRRITVGSRFILGFSTFWHLENSNITGQDEWRANTAQRRANCDVVLFFYMNKRNTNTTCYYLVPSILMPNDFIILPGKKSAEMEQYKYFTFQDVLNKLLRLVKDPAKLFPSHGTE